MFTIRNSLTAVISTVYIVFGVVSGAKAETLTFDELGVPTPVDGLTIKGVTFDYKINGVNSTDATYNNFDFDRFPFPIVANLKSPILEGNANGILTLDFAAPISALKFDVAVEAFRPIPNALNVELFDTSLKSLSTVPVDTNVLIALSQGVFSYSGLPVQRAVLNFAPVGFQRFALDNLSYTKVPEPSLLVSLFALGVVSGGLHLSHKGRQP